MGVEIRKSKRGSGETVAKTMQQVDASRGCLEPDGWGRFSRKEAALPFGLMGDKSSRQKSHR